MHSASDHPGRAGAATRGDGSAGREHAAKRLCPAPGPVFVLTWRRRYRSWRLDCLLLGASLLLLGLLPALIASPEGALEPLRYAAQRPLHVESLAGMLLWTTSSWIPGGARLVFSYGSNNMVGPLEGIYSTLFAGLFVVGLGAGYLLARRRDGLVEGVLLLLIVTLVTNKVFSPQYILWARATHRGLLRGSTAALAGRGHPCIFHLGRRGAALCGGPVTDAIGRGAIPLAIIRGTGAGSGSAMR